MRVDQSGDYEEKKWHSLAWPAENRVGDLRTGSGSLWWQYPARSQLTVTVTITNRKARNRQLLGTIMSCQHVISCHVMSICHSPLWWCLMVSDHFQSSSLGMTIDYQVRAIRWVASRYRVTVESLLCWAVQSVHFSWILPVRKDDIQMVYKIYNILANNIITNNIITNNNMTNSIMTKNSVTFLWV